MSHSTPGEQTEAVELLVQFANRGDLRAQFGFIDSVRLNRAAAVIGDAEILQAELLRGFRHFFERVVTVARGRVAMKRAAQIFLLDQLRQANGFRPPRIRRSFRAAPAE